MDQTKQKRKQKHTTQNKCHIQHECKKQVSRFMLNFNLHKIIYFARFKCSQKKFLNRSNLFLLFENRILGVTNSTSLKESRPRDWTVLTRTDMSRISSDHPPFPKLPLLPNAEVCLRYCVILKKDLWFPRAINTHIKKESTNRAPQIMVFSPYTLVRT